MTVGSGISPDLLTPAMCGALAGSAHVRHTAGGEFHPALRTCRTMRPCQLTAAP